MTSDMEEELSERFPGAYFKVSTINFLTGEMAPLGSCFVEAIVGHRFSLFQVPLDPDGAAEIMRPSIDAALSHRTGG
jgi:hypothetical protein